MGILSSISKEVSMKDNPVQETTSTDDKKRIKELEAKLAKKESEIEFFKDKINTNQEIILDVIEEKKLLKKQIEEFERKELDVKLNNYLELQRKHHKVEHRLFVTKNLLDEAQAELEFRAKIIEELENQGIMDLVLGKYPDNYLEYKKRGE